MDLNEPVLLKTFRTDLGEDIGRSACDKCLPPLLGKPLPEQADMSRSIQHVCKNSVGLCVEPHLPVSGAFYTEGQLQSFWGRNKSHLWT